MIFYESGAKDVILDGKDVEVGIYSALEKLGPRRKVLVVPPDFTRYHSRAGEITTLVYKYYKDKLKDILPALGTHAPMSDNEIEEMYKDIPKSLFRIHDWRNDIINAGTVPGEFVSSITNGALDYSWPAQLNKIILNGNHDLILSVGQVVPHEVIGMANYNKNLFVGTGGSEGINKSHFIGAVYGMEKILGKADNPVRRLFNYASENFITHLPVVYILTVIGRDIDGKLVMRGLFIGDDEDVFIRAARLSAEINISITDRPLKKIVVYLDPSEYKSTWLGNKSIYRTRMSLADDGQLIVIAPGLKTFGEDSEINRLIRKFGYRGTEYTLSCLKDNPDLSENLSAAAHLIHGSSEGRFSVTYCPGHLTKDEIESVNFRYMDLSSALKRYNPDNLKEGRNLMADGEEIYYISNPAVGLWSVKDKINLKTE